MANESNYYQNIRAYEIPFNVLDSEDEHAAQARNVLYEKLNVIPDRYERFYLKLNLHQLKDTLNYLVIYSAFFRSTSGLPMSEYVEARDLKDNIKKELEDFFDSTDCEYKQLNIKSLL